MINIDVNMTSDHRYVMLTSVFPVTTLPACQPAMLHHRLLFILYQKAQGTISASLWHTRNSSVDMRRSRLFDVNIYIKETLRKGGFLMVGGSSRRLGINRCLQSDFQTVAATGRVGERWCTLLSRLHMRQSHGRGRGGRGGSRSEFLIKTNRDLHWS